MNTPLTLLISLIWPLAIIATAVAFVNIVGASAWLWLILAFVIVLAHFTRPQPPSAA